MLDALKDIEMLFDNQALIQYHIIRLPLSAPVHNRPEYLYQ